MRQRPHGLGVEEQRTGPSAAVAYRGDKSTSRAIRLSMQLLNYSLLN